MSKIEVVAKMFVDATTREEIDEIFEEHCSQYNGHSELSRIARLVQELVKDGFDPSLAEVLPPSTAAKNQDGIKVHYAEYLLRMKARSFRIKTDEKKVQKRETRQAEGKTRAKLDFMKLYDFATNFLVNGDWRAKTIAVRLFTGRRAGEVLYRSNFSEYGEYAIKVTYLSKVPGEQQSSSAVIPTLIPAKEVETLVESLREEWHLAMPQHWEKYREILSEKGRMQAGEAIKSNVQNPVTEFFATSVKPLFPELGLEDEEGEEAKAHSLRGVYGCVLYRLMGGHDNEFSEDYMQKALVHVSGATTSKYRKYPLVNFEPLLEQHPEIESMLKLKEIGWIEESSMISAFAIDSLVNQISNEEWKAKILAAIGSQDPEELGDFLGGLIERGIETRKTPVTTSGKPDEIKDATYKGNTQSKGAKRIQAIVDAIVAVNQMGEDLAATTPLIQEVHENLYGTKPNLTTCKAVLVDNQEVVSQLPSHNRNISSDKMDALIQEVLSQHGEPLQL